MNLNKKLKLFALMAAINLVMSIESIGIQVSVPVDHAKKSQLKEAKETGEISARRYDEAMSNLSFAFVPYERGLTTGKDFLDSIVEVRPDLDRTRIFALITGRGVIADNEDLLFFDPSMNTRGIRIFERKADAAVAK